MIKNYIILTSLNFLFPKNYNNYIYAISDYVFVNYKSYINKFKKIIIFKHRWLNHNKLSMDCKYINKLNKKIIRQIFKELNKIHGKNYSEKFWYTLISPWSLRFIQIIFERWQSINLILNKTKNKKFIVNVINFQDEQIFIPLTTEDSSKLYFNDFWNQFITQKIARNFCKRIIFKKKYKINKINFNFQLNDHSLKKYPSKRLSLKSIFSNLITNLTKIFSKKNNDYFIHNTYLGFWRETLLCLKLGQLPTFDQFRFYSKKRGKINIKLRNSFKSKINLRGDFESFITQLFCDQIPIVFLEKFSELEKSAKSNSQLPESPKKIFSGNILWINSLLNYYCASKIENNSKLIYSQHGGAYGIAKTHYNSDYEIEQADNFLSYGWKTNNKTIPFGNIKNINKLNFPFYKKKYLLFIMNSRRKYFTVLNSAALWNINFLNILKSYYVFLLNLNKEIKNKTIIRTMPFTKIEDTDFFSKITKNFKSDNTQNIFKLYQKSKLVIHVLNSTSLIETLNLNIPSIIIFSKDEKFSNIGTKVFKKLKKANIFFDDSKEAYKFVNKIWNNGVETWWNSSEAQKAVRYFNLNFSKKRTNVLSDLKKILKN